MYLCKIVLEAMLVVQLKEMSKNNIDYYLMDMDLT